MNYLKLQENNLRQQYKHRILMMNWFMNNLEAIANFAAILTAVVALFGYGAYRWDQYEKRKKLENYLKAEKDVGNDKGQRSLLHLMAKLDMTENQLKKAASKSKNIVTKVTVKEKTGKADTLLLEWKE